MELRSRLGRYLLHFLQLKMDSLNIDHSYQQPDWQNTDRPIPTYSTSSLPLKMHTLTMELFTRRWTTTRLDLESKMHGTLSSMCCIIILVLIWSQQLTAWAGTYLQSFISLYLRCIGSSVECDEQPDWTLSQRCMKSCQACAA